MLQANVHIEVLHVDVHFAHSVLIFLALGVQVLDNALELLNVIPVCRDTFLIPIQHRES